MGPQWAVGWGAAERGGGLRRRYPAASPQARSATAFSSPSPCGRERARPPGGAEGRPQRGGCIKQVCGRVESLTGSLPEDSGCAEGW